MRSKNTENIKIKLRKYSNYILILFLLMFVFSMFRSLTKTKKALINIDEKEERVNVLRRQNEELEKRIAEMKSPEYIETQIRNNLGLSKEGEIVVVLPDDETLRKLAPVAIEDEEVLPDPNWKKWIELFM